MIPVHQHTDGITFSVKVHPRARRNAITGVLGDAIKLDLTAPPVDGRANEAVTHFFAEFLKLPPSSITIAGGKSGHLKIIRISGITAGQLRRRLSGFESKEGK